MKAELKAAIDAEIAAKKARRAFDKKIGDTHVQFLASGAVSLQVRDVPGARPYVMPFSVALSVAEHIIAVLDAPETA